MQSLQLNEQRFVGLLEKLVGEGEKLQNQPPKLIPTEDLAVAHIRQVLDPFSKANGGVLDVEHVVFTEGRGNLIISYLHPDFEKETSILSFVGSHMDVVYANRDNWTRDPFKLSIEGDELHGRGTTDCLGHCALLTDIFSQLAETKPKLGGLKVVAVLISDEEAGGNSEEDIGVEALHKHGHLDQLKAGPLFWLDCADKQPNIGSGGVVGWSVTVKGAMCHSGFPHKGINSFELCTLVVREIQKAFYEAFKRHPKEEEYGFESSSSFKPTKVSMDEASLNQIPGRCTVSGDIRLIPFYQIADAVKLVEETVAKFSERANLEALYESAKDSQGPDSKFVVERGEKEVKMPSVTIEWLSTPVQGLACHLDSPGFKALEEATTKIIGHCHPLADTGSLPLVADLQQDGFDVQTVGYGVEDAYHADNEYALLSDFKQGFQVLSLIIDSLSPSAQA